jgi:hypothetical protein
MGFQPPDRPVLPYSWPFLVIVRAAAERAKALLREGSDPAPVALQLAFRTVQRRLTAVSALKTSFRPHDTYGMVWWIHPGILKVGHNRAGEVRRHPHVIRKRSTDPTVRTA